MLKPLGNRLIVKPDPIQKETKTGLIIEYGSNEKLEKWARITGTVVSVGDLCWYDYPGWPNNPWVKVGDKVFWAKYAGKVIVDPFTGEDFLALNDDDIIVSAHDDN